MDIALQRLFNERLLGERFENPGDAVRWLGAVQSQDFPGAKWALGQRTTGCTDADVDAAFNAGTFLRTHVLRPTWHFVAAEDIRWMLALTAARVHAANAYQYRKLELDETVLSTSRSIFERNLQDGRQLTRTELAGKLETAGIVASGLRLGYIFMAAELDGVICSGAVQGKQQTYGLLEERVPAAAPLSREEALGALATRYFSSRAPARVVDFAWWSGLTITEAKRAIELAKAGLQRDEIDGKTFRSSGSPEASSTAEVSCHLLPNYDELLIAFRDHSPTFDAARFDMPAPPGAFDGHILVLNGKVIGGWRRTFQGKAVSLEASSLIRLGDGEMHALRQSAEAYGRFINKEIVLRVNGPDGESR